MELNDLKELAGAFKKIRSNNFTLSEDDIKEFDKAWNKLGNIFFSLWT